MTSNLIAIESGNLAAAGYDAETETLTIKFRSNGAVYAYDDVPVHIYEGLMGATSKGQYFHDYIRPTYTGKKVGK